MKKFITATFAVLFCMSLPVFAKAMKIGSGAGYKQPVMKLVNKLKADGADIDPIFGN